MVLDGGGKAAAAYPASDVHLIGPVAVDVVAVLLQQEVVLAHGQQPAQVVVGVGEAAGQGADGLGAGYDPAAVVAGQLVGVDRQAGQGEADGRNLAVAVEVATQGKDTVGHRPGQTVGRVAADGAKKGTDWREKGDRFIFPPFWDGPDRVFLCAGRVCRIFHPQTSRSRQVGPAVSLP